MVRTAAEPPTENYVSVIANKTDADVPNAKTNKWVKSAAANRNISIYKGKDELPEARWLGKGTNVITFFWLNFK